MTIEEEFIRFKNAKKAKDESIAIRRIDAILWFDKICKSYQEIREALDKSFSVGEFYQNI